MNRIYRFIRMFIGLFAVSGLASIGLYFALRAAYRHSPLILWCPVFCRERPYWNQFPIPYLLAIALSFALLSAAWLNLGPRVNSRLTWVQIGATPIAALILAGALCGALWAYYDMRAGFFPATPILIDYVGQSIQAGILTCGSHIPTGAFR